MHILLIKHNTPKLRYYPYRIYFLRFPFVLSYFLFSSNTIQSIPMISASDNPPYTHASNINCSSEIIIQIYKFYSTFPNKKPPKFWLLSGGLTHGMQGFYLCLLFEYSGSMLFLSCLFCHLLTIRNLFLSFSLCHNLQWLKFLI